MQAGTLRRRITLEIPVQTSQDSMGAPVSQWTTFAQNVPASIESLTGREFFAAQQVQADVTTKITIRWRPGVTELMRAKHSLGGLPPAFEYYDIEAVLPDDTGRVSLQLLCRLRKADGFRSDG